MKILRNENFYGTYANSSAKQRYEQALCRFYKHVLKAKKRCVYVVVLMPYTRCCKSLAYEFETLKLNNMKEVIEKLNEGLKDPEYRQGWVANIAMAQIDCERWYREENNKVGKYLNTKDKHAIANKGAEYFLELLSK